MIILLFYDFFLKKIPLIMKTFRSFSKQYFHFTTVMLLLFSSTWLHTYTVEEEMLHYANMAKAQCLVMQVNGRPEIRKQALQCFIQACTYVSC